MSTRPNIQIEDELYRRICVRAAAEGLTKGEYILRSLATAVKVGEAVERVECKRIERKTGGAK